MKSELTRLSPAALEYRLKLLELEKPGSTSNQMSAWLSRYNKLQAELHKVRTQDYH